MKIWLIKLVIIVAVVVGIAFYGYKNVSPYERCMAFKDDFARLAVEQVKSDTCKRYSGQLLPACVNGRMRELCKKLTHW